MCAIFLGVIKVTYNIPQPIKYLCCFLYCLPLRLCSCLWYAVLAAQFWRCSCVGALVWDVYLTVCDVYIYRIFELDDFMGYNSYMKLFFQSKAFASHIIDSVLPAHWLPLWYFWKVISCSASCALEDGCISFRHLSPVISVGMWPLLVHSFSFFT